MDRLIINGGKQLEGTISVSGSKKRNAFPLLLQLRFWQTVPALFTTFPNLNGH